MSASFTRVSSVVAIILFLGQGENMFRESYDLWFRNQVSKKMGKMFWDILPKWKWNNTWIYQTQVLEFFILNQRRLGAI